MNLCVHCVKWAGVRNLGLARVESHCLFKILTVQCTGMRIQSFIFTVSDLSIQITPTLPAQNMSITQVLFTWYLLWGKFFHFSPALPIPYLWSSTHAAHLIILIHINSCLPKQLLPSNWVPDEEHSSYPNSLLPCNFGTGPFAPCLS